MLVGALNSSGQYALSSGKINADLVAQGAGSGGLGGAAPHCQQGAACCLCLHRGALGGILQEALGPRGLSAGAE